MTGIHVVSTLSSCACVHVHVHVLGLGGPGCGSAASSCAWGSRLPHTLTSTGPSWPLHSDHPSGWETDSCSNVHFPSDESDGDSFHVLMGLFMFSLEKCQVRPFACFILPVFNH